MKSRRGPRAAAGLLLCLVGFVLARASPYREGSVIVGGPGCRMVTDVIDSGSDEARGSVILLHGLSANKKIVTYLAQGFANQNLRVFVPDLPGHGRTPGPFSPQRAEECTESLLRQLIARRAINPQETILAGHSMGGAIAIRAAARVPVAGVIAISPAPMRATHGTRAEALLYTNPPPLPANTLIINGSFEPESMRGPAQDLLTDGNASYAAGVVIPHATHVSLLFDARAMRASQEWAARVLNLNSVGALPSRRILIGGFAGLAGLLLLAGPFLRELVGMIPNKGEQEDQAARMTTVKGTAGARAEAPSRTVWPAARLCLQMAGASSLTILLLRFWVPLREAVRMYEGGYFASFVLCAGIALLLVNIKSLATLKPARIAPLAAAAVAAIVLHLLFAGWLDLTLTESWLTTERWLRFPVFFLAVLPFHAAEELLLGPGETRPGRSRLALALLLRVIAWAAVLAGIFWLHSGEILLLLLAPYFALFCLLQRRGMDIVRKETASALAAALFGAILLAGFCLVIFPVI